MKAHDAALSVDVLVQSPKWKDHRGAAAAVRKAINAAADEVSSPNGEVAVLLTNDAAIRKLNKKWRKIDKPTNVLSFPALRAEGARNPDDPPPMLGDIAIAYETTRREADDEGKPFDHHLSHLAVHGFLHLIGYDHETDTDAEEMENLERQILAQLGIPDPYADRERVT
jgi:probable rRNA maturation factor